MRMWNVPVAAMCDKHLIGEHGELGLFVWNIEHNKKLDGYYAGGLMDTRLIQARHDALAAEMLQRGFQHRSSMVYVDRLGLGSVDAEANVRELERRCARCRERSGGQ